MNAKHFKDVQIGDIAIMNYGAPDIQGSIMWKGTFGELKENETYQSFAELIEDSDPDEVGDYLWVIVNTKEEGPTLFNYNCDPSGVLVEQKIILGPYTYNEELEKLAAKIVGNGDGPELYFISVTNALYKKDEVINSGEERSLVIGVTSDKFRAESIYDGILLLREVRGKMIEGINGIIKETKTEVTQIHNIKEFNYD